MGARPMAALKLPARRVLHRGRLVRLEPVDERSPLFGRLDGAL